MDQELRTSHTELLKILVPKSDTEVFSEALLAAAFSIQMRIARLEVLNKKLVAALEASKQFIEDCAADRAYGAGLGASEWESCMTNAEVALHKTVCAALEKAKGENDGTARRTNL
jgi:hypothetical protein